MTDSTHNKTHNSTSLTPIKQAESGIVKAGSGLRLGGGLHARLHRANLTSAIDPLTRQDRIVLMLDVSGSMSGVKIQSLRDAVVSFINTCDMATVALALEPFGDDYPSPNRVALTCLQPMLITTSMMLQATGNTPLARALDYVIETYPLTRGVVVSDGEPDLEKPCYTSALLYREAGVPVDCVHIGTSPNGEACLRRIAQITNGQYIKFTDIASFSKSFKFLTPAFYAYLTSGSIDAAQIGAKEVK